ncbi:MAG: cell division protein FtsZ [Fusobacteriaceae bacterium]|jgi:cell division protein FtsZ|nr:cell division protein FtsZ [Fusobacteriaceae bacterium]
MLQESQTAKIMVIGVGGGGGNAINDMTESGVTGVEFVAANTDVQDLNKSLSDTRLQLGERLTKGRGAGGDPEVGRQSAEEDREKIAKLLKGVDMVFITAGMGGGTGTGASPIIAEIAREMDILTVAVVTKPFNFEGKKRSANAERGIENLTKAVDSIVIIPNEKLFELPEKKITLKNAFHEANKVLKIGIQGISDLMLKPGLVNLDFADIISILKNSGVAMFGFGESDAKENRAYEAATKALESPLLERQIQGASKLLLNITADESFGLEEAQQVTDLINKASGKEIEVNQWGIIQDERMGSKVQVTLIATCFTDVGNPNVNPDNNQKTPPRGTSISNPPTKPGDPANEDPPWKIFGQIKK